MRDSGPDQDKKARSGAGPRRPGNSRTVSLLGAIFTYAARHRMRADNPVHGGMRFAEAGESGGCAMANAPRLGVALRQGEADGIWPGP